MRGLVLAACSLGLVGCPTLTPASGTRIEATGTWEHPASGLRFPESVAGFDRVQIVQFDRAGKDIGVGYNCERFSASVALTVYVYPAGKRASGEPASLSEDFESAKRALQDHHPGAVESWVRDESMASDDGPVPVKIAEFRYTEEFAQRRQPVVSQLHLAGFRGQLLKYRVTFAAVQEASARRATANLLRAAPWTKPAD